MGGIAAFTEAADLSGDADRRGRHLACTSIVSDDIQATSADEVPLGLPCLLGYGIRARLVGARSVLVW
jgi:hypothetical protein